MEKSERRRVMRPTIRSAALSPTALSNLAASLALFGCLMLPHSVGCNDQRVRPIALVADGVAAGELFQLVVLWPYAFALATILTFATVVVMRPTWFDWALLLLPVGIAVVLLIIWLALLVSTPQESRDAMLVAAIIAPFGAIVAARMIWVYRRGDTAAAAMWGQGFLCVLGTFSLRWFWFPPIKVMLWGGFLSICCLILMMMASWTWPTRAHHDLLDRSVAVKVFQISLRRIILAITAVAIALTYWKAFAN